MPSGNTSFIKPFVTGAVTALVGAWMWQRVWQTNGNSWKRRRTVHKNKKKRALLLDSPTLSERMIRKAEAAIRGRTSRLVIVVERCTNDHNYSAILRTAEALGIQYVYIVSPPLVNDTTTKVTSSTGKVIKTATTQEVTTRAMHHLFAQRATEWLTVQEFETTAECLKVLRKQGYQIWATDLSQQAVCLSNDDLPLQSNHSVIPEKLAIVFGTEAVGCTQELLEAADLRVYLPLRGFADSLNLSVATALVVQQLFILDPTLIGAMTPNERRVLRREWFAKLAKQRLLTSSQKKLKARLQAKLQQLDALQHELHQGKSLHPVQLEKLQQRAAIQRELNEMERELQVKADLAVQDLVDHPPEPISDMRRPDEHRTCYVGKNTKKRNSQAWDNMPATTGFDTSTVASTSANYFRKRVHEPTLSQQED